MEASQLTSQPTNWREGMWDSPAERRPEYPLKPSSAPARRLVTGSREHRSKPLRTSQRHLPRRTLHAPGTPSSGAHEVSTPHVRGAPPKCVRLPTRGPNGRQLHTPRTSPASHPPPRPLCPLIVRGTRGETSPLPVQIWKVHRKLLNPAFNQTILDGFIDVHNRQARRLVKDLQVEVDKGPFDHFTYILLNVLETTCLTVMAVDFSDESLLNSEYVHAAEDMLEYIMERFQKPWLHSDVVFNWSSLKRMQDECLKILHNMSNTVLKKRKAEYLYNKQCKETEDTIKGPKLQTFMDLLLELAIEKGAFNDREIRDHVDTILIGGHDTSASVLMYTMLLVGSYHEVQENIYEELDNVFGNEDRDVTKQDLSQLVYLEAVLKESMRIYPIAPIIARKLHQDIKLRN
ncbi:cytochrome P450 4C1-like isoform X3 [Maniola hyperantus]